VTVLSGLVRSARRLGRWREWRGTWLIPTLVNRQAARRPVRADRCGATQIFRIPDERRGPRLNLLSVSDSGALSTIHGRDPLAVTTQYLGPGPRRSSGMRVVSHTNVSWIRANAKRYGLSRRDGITNSLNWIGPV
jgi:hypothetical protein